LPQVANGRYTIEMTPQISAQKRFFSCAIFVAAGTLAWATTACGNRASGEPARAAPVAPPELEGRWTSESCVPAAQEDGGTLYLSRAFELTDRSWSLALTTHVDDGCTQPLLLVDVAGAYEVQGPSAQVTDAFDARFERADVRLTPRTAGTTALLDQAKCGAASWKADEAQSVAQGCLFLPPIEDCPAEYDLVRRHENRLWFGLRTASLCTEAGRPTAIDEHAMVKVEVTP